MAGSTYRQYRQSLVPTTHQRPQGQAWQGLMGDVEDTLVDRAKQAVKARFPLLAPPDALTALGVERQLPQGPSETTAAYGARVQNAWNTWPWAGTAYGLLSALQVLGYTNVYLETCRAQQYTLPAGSTTLTIASLAAGQWFIDSNRAPAGTTAWAPSFAYWAGAAVVPSAVAWAAS